MDKKQSLTDDQVMQAYRNMLDRIEGETELFADDDPSLAQKKGTYGTFRMTVADAPDSVYLGAYAYLLQLLCSQKLVLFFVKENGTSTPLVAEPDEEQEAGAFGRSLKELLNELKSYGNVDLAPLYKEYDVAPDLFFSCSEELSPEGTFSLSVTKKAEGGCSLALSYAADLFLEDTIRRFAGLYALIVSGFSEGRALKDITLADEKAIAEMDSFNRTAKDYPVTDIVSMFREAADRYPDHPAVRYQNKTLTYKEVDDISERIAAHLISLGIGSGDVVSILIDRSEFMVTASLGVLKSGAGYQPLASDYPSERLTFMMQDASCKLLIADENLMEKVPDYNGPVFYTKEIDGLPVCEKLSSHPAPGDLFIMLYTSGSTGTPKGVMLEHGNLANFCFWYREKFGLDDKAKVAAYASYGFDACMMDLYTTLTAGACLYILTEEIRIDIPAMEKMFIEEGITHSFMTTQVARQFYSIANVPSLKYSMGGGEALVPFKPRDISTRFINGYGPTECTILTTSTSVDRLYKRVPIGKPLANYRLYVVDKNLRRLPPFVPGELLIAGRGVARGYLNRPEQTEKAFIKNPFCGDAEYAKAYRSGDVVRLLADGTIDFIGRNDSQVKVRGFRIELTEVEGVIREYPAVKDACVTARSLGEGGKAVAAYIVSDETVDIEDLKNFILERKPPYMVPAWIMQIDAIPLNQNGKVNRRVLPDPTSAPSGIAAEEEERGEENILLSELRKEICDITGRESISASSPLEYAGLTSIGIIRLSAFIYKNYGIALSAENFKGLNLYGLENTILAAWMRGEGRTSGAGAAEEDDFSPYPLSPAQLGVYVECVKHPESTVYNIPVRLEFTADTDTEALKNAIRSVIKAHPSVQVHFETVKDQVMAVRNEILEPEIPVMEMSHEKCLAYQHEFAAAFPLNKGPLYFFAIVKTEKALFLFMDFHHLIFDGFSLDLFLRDLADEMGGKGCTAETSGYGNFVRSQQELLKGDFFGTDQEYFDRIFEKYESPSRITPDKPGSDKAGKLTLYREDFPQELAEKVCKRTGVTEAAYYLAALYYVTARLTNSDNVYISTISAGRTDSRFLQTYGMFVNTLPLFSELTAGSVDEFIQKSAADFREAISHESYPFAGIASKWDYSVELMYAYQRGIFEKPDIPGLLSVREEEQGAAMFPFYVRIVDGEDNPAIEIAYDESLYTEELVAAFLRYYRTVLENFAGDGAAALRRVSLLDEKERKLLDEFYTVPEEGEVPEDTFLFTGMEKNAELYPDRTALIATDGTFTYKEFDNITNRVANALIKRGAKVGGKALILLPRTSRALFAFFGASKAGLGYIPFDPEYPIERINLVIEDSDAGFVITDQKNIPRFEGKDCLDIEELLLEEDETRPQVPLTQDNISYMIYTSGSTGRPKGVVLRHYGNAHYVADLPGKEMVNSIKKYGKVYCSITTLSFDISVMEYTLALNLGLTLYFANEAECNNAELLAKRMIETKSDVISGTPTRIYTLLSSEAFRDALKQYGQLVICGGEKYSEKLMTELKKLVPHPMNIYGPSEITISCNEHDLMGEDVITVGKPTPGVTEYVVDTDGNELPIGVVGEVYIGGWGVGIGYNNLPEMTNSRFIDFRGERVYKSGDYARWLPNGYLEIIGRKDNQIKLRGLRIELGEVETVLAAQEGMKYVAVKIEKINGIEHLCAWFTNENKVEIPALKESLAKTLTPYMVPTAYMQMEKMPFMPNGKMDMKNLPIPEVYRSEGDAAKSAAEKAFCEIFSELLNVDNVLATESFFDLGGTSLLVTQVVIEAGKKGYSIVFGDVFANPTPRALASLFEEAAVEEVQEHDSEIEDYDYTEIHEFLKRNTIEAFRSGERHTLGNVLMTGATGYLGIHILYELLEKTDCRIYCLLRSSADQSAENRLSSLLFYYFDNDYRDLMGSRLFVYEGDVTNRASFDQLAGEKIDTVINCAAIVKHFSYDTIIEDVNVGGAKNVIDFCLEQGAVMIQTSTMSVIEIGYKDTTPEGFSPSEQTLYCGQDLTNQYVRSKFLAERAILEAIIHKGLKAKIMRYGNLSARYKDGEFQVNFDSNAAMGQLRAYAILGCAPYDQAEDLMEFSPISSVADATVRLCATPEDCVVFNVITDQYISKIHIFHEMEAMGYPVKMMERDDYEKAFAAAGSDPKKASLLTSLMAYDVGKGERPRVMYSMNRELTLQILYRLGFFWPTTSWDYLRRFLQVLSGLGYFLEDFDEGTQN